MLEDYDQSEELLSGEAFHNDKKNMVLNVLLQSLSMIDSAHENNNSRDLFAAPGIFT